MTGLQLCRNPKLRLVLGGAGNVLHCDLESIRFEMIHPNAAASARGRLVHSDLVGRAVKVQKEQSTDDYNS
jgi:hypothetical protein